MSLAILPLYMAVVLLCVQAALAARKAGRGRGELTGWLLVALAFCLLVLVRVSGAEDIVREILRGVLRDRGAYEMRGDVQVPLVLATLAICAAIFVAMVRKWRRLRDRRLRRLVLLSRFALAGYLPLFALRLVSLHATDRLLYAGPVKINWLADGALALLAAGSAAAYARALREAHAGSAPRDRH